MSDIRLRRITTSASAYPFVEALLHSAFPTNERRDDGPQRDNVDNEQAFKCYLIELDGSPIGLLTAWSLTGYHYIEHLAITPEHRCGGLGAKALAEFIGMVGTPIVLEVEPPVDELTRRRVAFYRRSGLKLWENFDYLQPPYRQGDSPTPLMLMATEGLRPEADFERVKSEILRRVYHQWIIDN